MSRHGVPVKREDVSGTSTLVRTARVGGVECLEIASEMEIRNFAPPFPSNVTVTSGSMRIRFAGKFPADASVPMVEGTTEATVTFQAKVRPGGGKPEITADKTQTTTVTAKYVYAK
jgi:hypothetical protein